MAALGAKCLVGDQLHPRGAINHDTYASIAPAYARLEKMEPFLRGAKQVSEIAILCAEQFHPEYRRNHESDDGAAQMLQELKRPFDVIDADADFGRYRLLILPDDVPVSVDLKAKLEAYRDGGGKLLLSGRSGLNPEGKAFALDLGVTRSETPMAFDPSYIQIRDAALDAGLPKGPFVVYGSGEVIKATKAKVLADIMPSYFNRSYKHFSSHQHTPDDPTATAIGAAITEHNGIAYVAYPIFRIYRDIGQPLYKYVIRGLIDRLAPDPVFTSDLPSAGRATLTHQTSENRHVLHLLFGTPQVRGKSVRNPDGSSRMLEMIEDVPSIGPVRARVRLAKPPVRVYDAASGRKVDWTIGSDGKVEVEIPNLHIHAAVVFESN